MSTKNSKWALLLLSRIFFSNSCIFAMTVTGLQEKMKESELSVKTIRFSYVQEMRSGLTGESRSSTGTAWFRRPGEFRIEQTGPEKQLVISSGKTVYVFTPRFHQALKEPRKKWASSNFFFPGWIALSRAFDDLKRDYDWKLSDVIVMDGEKTLPVELTGKRASQSGRLTLWLGESDYLPRKTEWVQDSIILSTSFSSIALNTELNPQIFQFKAGKGVDVIEAP